jgi:hypothetical protein
MGLARLLALECIARLKVLFSVLIEEEKKTGHIGWMRPVVVDR